jgi:hypothetical protein
MAPKRTVSARDIVTDIRAGLTDSQLMDKYGLSAKGLESLFTKLIEAGVMESSEIYGRSARDDTVGLENMRALTRRYPAFAVPIYEADEPYREGTILDVTERGLQVSGIEVAVGDTRDFLVRGDQFQDIYPFGFQATCRWAKRDGEEWRAGLEITEMPEGSREQLQKLIKLLTIGT